MTEEQIGKLYSAHAKCLAVKTIALLRNDLDTANDLQKAMNFIQEVIQAYE
jgi:hypothetical protein